LVYVILICETFTSAVFAWILQAGTIPQGIVDMNQCSDVHCAEIETGHQFSIAIVSAKGSTYIKGSSREEINR